MKSLRAQCLTEHILGANWHLVMLQRGKRLGRSQVTGARQLPPEVPRLGSEVGTGLVV